MEAWPVSQRSLRHVVQDLLACTTELRGHLFGRLRNADDAADIAQASFVQAYAHALVAPVHNPRALIFHVARNLVVDQHRRRLVEAEVLKAWFDRAETLAPSAEQVAAGRQQWRQLVARVEAMPPLRREVFVRVRVHGQSHAEVAQALSLTAAAIEKHIARAVFDLSALLAAWHGDLGGHGDAAAADRSRPVCQPAFEPVLRPATAA
jgi:RNA polymerase sigma-70 factor (ECF subfamily)